MTYKIKISFFLAVLHCLTFKGFAQGIIIPSGAYVVQQNGNIVTHSNWTNNGNFTQNSGALVFSGTTQTLNGSSLPVFNNITISSGSTTSIGTTGEQIKGTVLCNGTLNANGNLTLLSTAAQTALIDGTGTGTVSGNVTMQRYIASGFGYKYFSSPFQAATVNEFANEVNLTAPFPPVYKYVENLPSNGWYYYTNATDPLNVLEGYAVNLGSSTAAMTADMTGMVNNGTVSRTLYNNNQVYTQGFNFVGNPYPSPIDWNAATGWTKTNIDNAIYYFDAGSIDQYTGTYSSYINGVSSNGIANNIIPAMQGFLVHVSNGTYPVSATLALTNSVRVNDLNPTYHKTTGNDDPQIRISMKYETETMRSDNVVIYFNGHATAAYEQELDALKINNTDINTPSLYTLSTNNLPLSINATPYPSDSFTVIPLGIETLTQGSLLLSLKETKHLPYGLHVYITDAQTLSYQDITENPVYRINMDQGINKTRYAVVFSKKDIKDTQLFLKTLNAYYADGKIQVSLSLSTGANGTLKIFSAAGQELYNNQLNGYGNHTIDAPFSSGIYMIKFYGNGTVYSKKLFIGN